MKKYFVNFGTGAGNYTSNLSLDELIEEVNEQLSYTQESVKIVEVETDEVAATLTWYGTSPEEDDIVTAQYGDFGFYGEWIKK